MSTSVEVAEKIQQKAKRPRQASGVYDPMEQAGHRDMIYISSLFNREGNGILDEFFEANVVVDKARLKFLAYALLEESGNLYDWLKENHLPLNESYIDVLKTFIRKELLKESTKVPESMGDFTCEKCGTSFGHMTEPLPQKCPNCGQEKSG